jgi:serine/threonine-protein kinase
MRPNPGDIIGGKYRILRMIGDGGMGSVFEARHEVLGTSAALKFLHSELARRPGLAARFLQEARVSASIQSPHVTKVTDVDTQPDGTPYIVMELLSGESLQQVLDRERKLPKDRAIDYALQVLSGLEAAHALGVVHRDLKPDNVFITPSPGGPILKLLDFGIAKLRQTNEYTKGLTRPGALMGTPEYMSPEQLYSADKVDHRADLYSLGVLLFEMLCGERPAGGEDAPAIVGNVMAGKIRRLDSFDAKLPAELVEVVHKAISADKQARFQSAQELRTALAPFAGELSHAGRLAATPIPAGASVTPKPETPAPKKTAPHPVAAAAPVTPAASEAPKPPEKPAVSPTLPPEDDATVKNPPTMGAGDDLGIKGATQEASKDLVAQLAQQNAAAQQTPGPVPHLANARSNVASAAQTPPPVYGGYGPPPVRKQKSGMGAIIALILGVVVTGGIITVVVLAKSGKDTATEPINIGTTSPNTTIAPQAGPDPTPAPVPDPGPAPPATDPGPKPTGTGKPKPKPDGGTDGGTGSDAGGVKWPFPVPSGIPTFPIPSFPIPGFEPPPSSSK